MLAAGVAEWPVAVQPFRWCPLLGCISVSATVLVWCCATAAIDGTGSTELGSTQQQQQTEDDAEWLSICQKAYADRMELLAGELAVAGSAAASALQQLVARTIAECNTSALAWQQQLMLQDAMYVLSVFAAYSDKIAAELLQQQTQTSDFQEAVNKLVHYFAVDPKPVKLMPSVHATFG